jgi:hypothetical protein
LAWWISQASILAGLLVPVPVRTAIWITALIWMGTACAGAAGAPISVAWTPFVHHRKEKNAKRVCCFERLKGQIEGEHGATEPREQKQ